MPPRNFAIPLRAIPLGRFGETLAALAAAGAADLHLDVCDGAFVPGIGGGPEWIAAARAAGTLPVHVHLMCSRPERQVPVYLAAGAATITVHPEACTHPHRVLTQIAEGGAGPGVALLPATPLTAIDYLLEEAARVLVLTAEPGAAGNRFHAASHDRVRLLHDNIRYRKLKTVIEVESPPEPRDAAIMFRFGARSAVLAPELLALEDPAGALKAYIDEAARLEHLV